MIADIMWKCLDCKKQFSVKVGSIFEDSPLGLDKWLCAMWLICNCKNGISPYEIARDLNITQKSAWFMLRRIRYAMQTGTFGKLSGQCEADETLHWWHSPQYALRRQRLGRFAGASRKARQSSWGFWPVVVKCGPL